MNDKKWHKAKWHEASHYLTSRFGPECGEFAFSDASSWLVGESKEHDDSFILQLYICDDSSPWHELYVVLRMEKNFRDGDPNIIFNKDLTSYELSNYQAAANYASELADKLHLENEDVCIPCTRTTTTF